MKKHSIFLALAFCFWCIVSGLAQPRTLVIADFDNGKKPNNLGEDFGTWEKDPADKTQSCLMSFANSDALGKIDGKSLHLEYDVDSPNPAYNGFWMKIGKAASTSKEVLSFYIKGDKEKGFTSTIKVEIKDKKKGKATFSISNINEHWQKITLKLPENMFDEVQTRPFEEFVVVFDDLNSQPKRGAIFLDQIEIAPDPQR